MLSAFMGFLEPGDEAIVFEPFFDQCVAVSAAVLIVTNSSKVY
jgi:aspartate/methionine/tyrosine aminotransferase